MAGKTDLPSEISAHNAARNPAENGGNDTPSVPEVSLPRVLPPFVGYESIAPLSRDMIVAEKLDAWHTGGGAQ